MPNYNIFDISEFNWMYANVVADHSRLLAEEKNWSNELSHKFFKGDKWKIESKVLSLKDARFKPVSGGKIHGKPAIHANISFSNKYTVPPFVYPVIVSISPLLDTPQIEKVKVNSAEITVMYKRDAASFAAAAKNGTSFQLLVMGQVK